MQLPRDATGQRLLWPAELGLACGLRSVRLSLLPAEDVGTRAEKARAGVAFTAAAFLLSAYTCHRSSTGSRSARERRGPDGPGHSLSERREDEGRSEGMQCADLSLVPPLRSPIGCHGSRQTAMSRN